MKFNKKLGTSFSTISKNYDKYRLNYPQKLIDDVVLYAKIKKSSNILEIGSGTGIASKYFLEKGFNLTMLDISKELMQIAQKKFKPYKKTNYIINSFEKSKLPINNFDLIFSAQAFHWVDSNLRFKKVHKLLKENSTLAVFWNFADRDKSKILQQIKKLYEKYCPDFKPGSGNKIILTLKDNPAFKNAKVKSYPRTILFTKSHYVELIQTYSWVVSLEAKQKEKLLIEIKKELSRYKEPLKIPYNTLLCMAKKQANLKKLS